METDTSIRAGYISKQSPVVINGDHGFLRRWLFATKANLGFAPKIAVGVSNFSSGCRSTLFGSVEEKHREKVCMVISGIMKLSTPSGEKRVLSYRDCAYAPPGVDYEIENVGYSDLKLAWVMAPSFESTATKTDESFGLGVVRTLSEVTPVQVNIQGLERSIYRIDLPRNFRFALFTRKAHTYSPLHTHDPPDFEEGYIVLQGSLKLTDLNGRSNILHEGDFAYVPPFGGNFNENVSDDEVHYLWCGAPAVSMKEIPVDPKLSRLQEMMSLKRESQH